MQSLAAIDIGTNTIRLLVARPTLAGERHELVALASRTATVRLGYGVERTGRLDQSRLALAVETVERYRREAETLGAETILVVATSAVRDASNGADLIARITEVTGLVPESIDGEREAMLTFAGATAGQSLDGRLLVADLGGGSLELIVARDGAIAAMVSLQLGSGRLTERHVRSDPAEPAMVSAAEADAEALLRQQGGLLAAIDRAIVVGGTATSLLILERTATKTRLLTEQHLASALARLMSAPSVTIARHTGLDQERVRTLAAGVAILTALLRTAGLAEMLVGAGGIREGLILDYVQARDQAPARRAIVGERLGRR